MSLLRTEAEGAPMPDSSWRLPGVYTQKPFPKSNIGLLKLFPAPSVDFPEPGRASTVSARPPALRPPCQHLAGPCERFPTGRLGPRAGAQRPTRGS